MLVAAVVLQTAGGIWWFAQLSSKIDSAVVTIGEFKTERYTREDARRDRELLDQKFIQVQSMMEQKFLQEQTTDREIDRRLNLLESKARP